MLDKPGASLDRSEDENNEERTEKDLSREKLTNMVIKHNKHVCVLFKFGGNPKQNSKTLLKQNEIRKFNISASLIMTNYDQFWVQVFITTTTYGVTMVVQYKEHIPV